MSVDTTLTCRDCGQAFTFTSDEQALYASRGHEHPPSRCAACRAQRKSDREAGGDTGGYSSFAGRGPRELFVASCATCGQEAKVPFQPSGDKPVYCRSCFEQRREATRGSRGRY
jgi:CxxC-x17-CxxC domain-containing protein